MEEIKLWAARSTFPLVLTGVLAPLSLEILDSSIVNVAIPDMTGNLGATLDNIGWVLTGYIIANAIILPIAPWIAGRFGRRTYFTAAIVFFTICSAGCGFAPNLGVLTFSCAFCRDLQEAHFFQPLKR